MAVRAVRPDPRWFRRASQTTFGHGQGAITLSTRRPLSFSAPLCKAKATPRERLRTTPKVEPSRRGPATQVSRPLSPEAAPIDTIYQQRKLPLVGAGFAALCLGLYVSLLVSSYVKSPPAPNGGACSHPSTTGSNGEPLPPTGRPPGVDAAVPGPGGEGGRGEARQSAAAFDKGLDVPEWLMGITGLRKQLAASAHGHVLEVAVGTGRNLSYYDWTGVEAANEEQPTAESDGETKAGENGTRATASSEQGLLSFTGVDISADMMSVARTRIRDAVPVLKKLMRRRRTEAMPESGGTVVDILDSRVRLCIGDAEATLPPPPVVGTNQQNRGLAVTKYDTIIQTFGLCSVADPAKLLSNMASVIRPGSGRIILLEHGRGWYDWVNGLLDRYADPHYQRYGCWWNRDLEAVIREAAEKVPGLEVMKLERPLLLQMGTTLLIELRVRSAEADAAT